MRWMISIARKEKEAMSLRKLREASIPDRMTEKPLKCYHQVQDK